jgi:hypothetical protein
MLNAGPPPRPGQPAAVRGGRPGSRRVLVLAAGPWPATDGAGRRAWGLAGGLAAAGHDVTLLSPAEAQPATLLPWTYAPERPADAVARWRPDIVVLQDWRLAAALDPGSLPLVIDLASPLRLDAAGADHAGDAASLAGALAALSRADLITCAGEELRLSLYPWLLLAGFDLREPAIEVVPAALPPDLPPHQPAGEVAFVCDSGCWADQAPALRALVARLAARGQGRLHCFGSLPAALPGAHERVVVHGPLPHDRRLAAYRRAHVAVDIAPPRPADGLSFDGRVAEYLWCGLPVIGSATAEPARLIRAYAAGWTVDPADPAAVAAAVDAVLADPAEVERRGRNARRLARERLTWDRTLAALDAFCRQPRKRRPRPARLAPPPAAGTGAGLPSDPARLLEQVEALAHQSHATATLLDGQARRRLAAPARLIDGAKQVVKRATGLDRRLVLADYGATLAGDFAGGVTHGQSFVRGEGSLHRIDVVFATFGRLNPSRLRFHLCALTPAGFGPDLVTLETPAAALPDNRFWAFVFPPLPPAPGQLLAFWLDSPDATATTSAGVWQVAAGPAAARQRYRDGRPVPGCLLFRLHERADPERAGPSAPATP